MIAIASLSAASSSLVRTDNSNVNDGSRIISTDGSETSISGDSSDGSTCTLNGFKFNIPEGYTKVSQESNDGSTFKKESTANFTNDKGDCIVITVKETSPDKNTTPKNPTTIAGIEGELTNLGQHYIFSYVKSANSISVSANNEMLIEEVIKTD